MNRLAYFSIMMLLLVGVVACSGLTSPEGVARQTLKEGASFPYRNERFYLVSNDGTFATVRVVAETRWSADSDWREQESNFTCQEISGNWSCKMGYWQDTSAQLSQDITNSQATQAAIPTPTPNCAYVTPPERFSNGAYRFDNKYHLSLQIPGTIEIPVRNNFNEDVNAISFTGNAGTTIDIAIEPIKGEYMLMSPANERVLAWKSKSGSGDGKRVSSVNLLCDGTYILYVYYLREDVTISISTR